MFGFNNAISDEAKDIISRNFHDVDGRPYFVSPVHERTFRGIVKHIKGLGGNAHDIAITYMFVMIKSIYGEDEVSQKWVAEVGKKCYALIPKGLLGKNMDLFTSVPTFEDGYAKKHWHTSIE